MPHGVMGACMGRDLHKKTPLLDVAVFKMYYILCHQNKGYAISPRDGAGDSANLSVS